MKAIPERKRCKQLGKGKMQPFTGFPRSATDSKEFGALPGNATKLLVELAIQYRGKNNGDFSYPWARAKLRGWKSPATLHAAKKELIDGGWIIQTRQGGKNRCSLFAVTWWSIDECGGKLEVGATNVPLNSWKKSTPVVRMGTELGLRDAGPLATA